MSFSPSHGAGAGRQAPDQTGLEGTAAARLWRAVLAAGLGLWWLGGLVCPVHAADASDLAGTGQASDWSQPTSEVQPGQAWQTLDPAIGVLEDPNGDLSLDALRALPEARWRAPRATPINAGFSSSVWWVRLKLHNGGGEPVDRLLYSRSALQDYLGVSVVHGDGTRTDFPTTGDRAPFAARPIPHTTPVFPLRLEAGETVQVYVRLAAYDGLHEQVSLSLLTNDRFLEWAQDRSMVFGIYYGLGLVLAIYSVFMFAWSRQRIFALYCGYIVSVMLWSATFTGHALQYLWPQSPGLNNQVMPLLMGSAFVFGQLFVSDVLQLATRLPTWARALRWLAAVCFLTSLPALFGEYSRAFLLSLPLGTVMGLMGVTCCFVLAVRGSRQALWAALAWTTLIVSGCVYLFEMLGLLHPSAYAGDAIMIGCALQVLLLGMGLADAADRLLRKSLAAEQSALVAQQALAANLEQQVRQRTVELEHANERLNELAITDALTGAFNRRHFNEKLEAELQRPRSEGQTPALCLIDVDHFKAYNDRYGHSRGDAVLKLIAATLRTGLRRAEDRPYRVGGEEFALLLQPADLATHRQQIEALRRAIESLGLAHADNPHGAVTASFGLVQMPVGADGPMPVNAETLYKEADRLLYEAKAAGRNRVESASLPAAQWAPPSNF